MIAIGNGELDNNANISDTIDCPNCGNVHEIVYGDEIKKDGTKEKCKLLSFYNCGNKTYLAGIGGKQYHPKVTDK